MTIETDNTLTERLESVLVDHPVRIAILFGSQTRGDSHENSDVDIAVVFDDVAPESSDYNDVLFGLSADIAATLETDAVDVVDIRRVSDSLLESILQDGTLLVGSERELRVLQNQLNEQPSSENQSPAKRFDDVLTAIDDHLV